MGTSQQTTGSNTSTLQFNPLAQGMYNQLIGSSGNALQGYINNPFGNALYTMGAGQSQKGAQQAGANNMAALNQNQLTSGLTGQAGAGWLAAQKAMTGRANQSMTSQANVSNVLSALQRQMAATGMGLSFSPQLTGQSGNFSQTQSTSGLGTWLPQVMGAGLSAAMGGLGGGMMGGGGGGGVMQPSYMPGSSIPGAMSSAFPGFGNTTGAIPGGGMPIMPPMSMMGYGQ